MIIKLFNGKNLLLQIALMLTFFVSMANREITIQSPQGFGPFYYFIYDLLNGSSILIYFAFFSLILIEGLLLQLIASMYRLVSRNNFIVVFIWFLLIFSNPTLASINPVIISTVIITWALFQLLAITEKANPLPNLFSVGFIFSLASLVYGNLIWFGFFLIIALLILSLFKGRTLIVSIVSFATPYIYYFLYLFVMDKHLSIYPLFSFEIGEWHFFQNGPHLWISVSIAIIVIILSIISISTVLIHLNSKLIQTRTLVKVLFAWLIASTILQLASGTWWYVHPIIIFVPLSLFISVFLDEQKRTLYYDIAIFSLLTFEILQLYYPHHA